MHPHQALPELPVVRGKEMQQLVNDHIVADLTVKRDQLSIEVEIPLERT